MSEKDAYSTGIDETETPASSNQSEQKHNHGRPSDTPGCPATKPLDLPREYGGRKGPEPVRYGDWEKNGRCIDF